MTKLPQTPPLSFTTEARHLRVVGTDEVLWRIYRSVGPHALGWDELRHWGPAPAMRWDPQTPPAAHDPGVGVLYAAGDATTAFGEVYQGPRKINRSEGGATLVGWQPSRELTLLDLTSNWPVRNGASASMMMGEKRSTQAWARQIFNVMGEDIDGLYAQSSITNRPVITLFQRTEILPAFPDRPQFHALLSDVTVESLAEIAAFDLGFELEIDN